MSSVEDRIAPDGLTAKRVSGVGLIGDIGASNARFSLVRPGKASPAHVYALNDYPSLPDAIEAYLHEEKPAEKPVQAVLAVASPVTGDQVTLTNHPWTFSVKARREQLGLRRLQVVNDFAANAVAVPHLGENDVLQVGGGARVEERADRRDRPRHRAWRQRVRAVPRDGKCGGAPARAATAPWRRQRRRKARSSI